VSFSAELSAFEAAGAAFSILPRFALAGERAGFSVLVSEAGASAEAWATSSFSAVATAVWDFFAADFWAFGFRIESSPPNWIRSLAAVVSSTLEK